jgi:hypothetical protein
MGIRSRPFSAQYARAREIGYHRMADEVLDIADDGTNDFVQRLKDSGETYLAFDADHTARSRLRVETRRPRVIPVYPVAVGKFRSMQRVAASNRARHTHCSVVASSKASSSSA